VLITLDIMMPPDVFAESTEDGFEHRIEILQGKSAKVAADSRHLFHLRGCFAKSTWANRAAEDKKLLVALKVGMHST